MENNIQRFDEYAGEIFADLYSNFPNPISIGYLEGCGYSIDIVENGKPTPEEAELYGHTAKWLHDAGYVWGDPIRYYMHNARLTPKGLEVLKIVPSSLKKNESLGQQIGEAVKEGSKDVLKNLVGIVFNEGVKLISQ